MNQHGETMKSKGRQYHSLKGRGTRSQVIETYHHLNTVQHRAILNLTDCPSRPDHKKCGRPHPIESGRAQGMDVFHKLDLYVVPVRCKVLLLIWSNRAQKMILKDQLNPNPKVDPIGLTQFLFSLQNLAVWPIMCLVCCTQFPPVEGAQSQTFSHALSLHPWLIRYLVRCLKQPTVYIRVCG